MCVPSKSFFLRGKIINEIYNYKTKEKKYEWHLKFWQELKKHFYLDIVTLNYDNIFEKNVFEKNEFVNGCVEIDETNKISVFNNNYLICYPNTKIK